MDGYETSMHSSMVKKPAGLVLPSRHMLGLGLAAMAVAWVLPVWSAEDIGSYEIGRAATEQEIRVWNIDVSPTGEGLPGGTGTVTQGSRLFAAKCAACHGPTGTEGPKDRLVGGRDTLTTAKPVRTIGSYWPYATTLYDYIRRAMPFDAPQSLSPDETYSVIAWLLFQNQLIAEDAVIDAQTLPKVQMPNRNGFIEDPRTDVR
jgi:S-disulfanyl-L-cysteine oxidoreductase SoxD